MDTTGDAGKATAPGRATAPGAEGATAAPSPAGEHPFGPDAAAILATEHWSLLASRSLIWNEAQSRATVCLSVLSASTIALALLADATGFGPQTTTLALVLLPVVLFLGIAAHGRLVEINREEVELSLAMNRLRHAYLEIAPALKPYFTTGHHDDEPGLAASYLAGGRPGLPRSCIEGAPLPALMDLGALPIGEAWAGDLTGSIWPAAWPRSPSTCCSPWRGWEAVSPMT